jgi:hypothetical protein
LATVRIAIAALEDLFSAPVVDPFAGRLERESGIERILRAIDGAGRRSGSIELEISLPAAGAEGRTAAEVEAAIRAYARAEIEAEHRELALTRRRGRQSLWIGVPVLALCLGLSTAATTVLGSGGLGDVLSNTFIIAGWVAMWRPAELLLYDWLPFRHRVILLKRLERARVRLLAE